MSVLGALLAGSLAGGVNGFFGAGGGMLLVPLLGKLCHLDDRQVFPASLSVMLPVTLVSLLFTKGPLPWGASLPYLLGGLLGGLAAGKLGGKLPGNWLHRGLGLLILMGGGRMLWT